MNKLIIILMLIALGINSIKTQAAPVGSAFSYQGELLEDGAPANGLYDFFITAKDENTLASSSLADLQFLDVLIENGLFTIPLVDLGSDNFDGDDIWLTIGVRKAESVFGAGTPYTFMDTLQRINAVPYAVQADYLAAGGANTNDILQFNGTDWVASDSSSLTTPWTDNGTGLGYLGKVGVGINNVTNGFSFQIKQVNANIHPFEITGLNGVGMLRLDNNGNLGVRIVNPQARLHVNSLVAQDPFKVDVGFANKFIINEFGNVGIGIETPSVPLHIDTDNPLPAIFDGGTGASVWFSELSALRGEVGSPSQFVNEDFGIVAFTGDLKLTANVGGTNGGGLTVTTTGDVKQSIDSSGVMKYMVDVNTCGFTVPTIAKSYNGIDSAPITIRDGSSGSGECIIEFPHDISSRFYQGSTSQLNRSVSCTQGVGVAINELRCIRYTSSSGVVSSGSIMVFVY